MSGYIAMPTLQVDPQLVPARIVHVFMPAHIEGQHTEKLVSVLAFSLHPTFITLPFDRLASIWISIDAFQEIFQLFCNIVIVWCCIERRFICLWECSWLQLAKTHRYASMDSKRERSNIGGFWFGDTCWVPINGSTQGRNIAGLTWKWLYFISSLLKALSGL